MNWPTSWKVGLWLLVVGLVPYLSAEYYIRFAHNWTPLDVRVTLKPGELRSPEFETDLNARYILSLAADQVSGSVVDKVECMMGYTFAPNIVSCDGTKQTAEFDWQIVSQDGAVLDGGPYKPYGLSYARLEFAEFQGHRGTRQRIILRIREDGGELNSYHPRILVEAAPESWEALPYLRFFALIWAGVLSVLGMIVIVVPICVEKAKQLTGRQG